MIDLALHYANRRWPVFPLVPGGKVPAIRGGHGCLDATLDRRRIEAWWAEYPEANIGIATGALSGLLVIDVDPRKTTDWLASVNALNLPQTFTVRTVSGGFHLYFAMLPDCKVTLGADLLPGIDWRGNGGYVVGAGSMIKGITYQIVRGSPIAPAPKHLIDRIAAHGKSVRTVERDTSGRMLIPNGKRNDKMFKIGCALRRFGVELNAIYEGLLAINADHCSPPMSADEVRSIAASTMRYAPDSASLAKDAGQ